MSNADSTVLDKRIMEFEFHNDQFEQGVRQSMQTLEMLKQSTTNAMHTIGTVGGGLKNLFAGFRTRNVEDNVQAISNRFSTMGIIGTTVLQRLTNAAVDLGLSLGKKVLSPLTSIFSIVKNRGWARASGIKQAQFMIQNLGMDWEKANGIIDKAVTDTRFGFDEAATAAAQLATSGIEFGEDMQNVLKAIGNAASMANVEYSDMAHLFTTMASNGRVYGMQLQQMSIRGINATKALADHLGKSEAQVKKLVSSGKVSFEDFVEAINEAFGEAAFKANETFSGVLANNKAVFARIGQVYASGFMDAAKVVLQHTLPVLKKLRDYIEPIGKVASKAMMLVANILTPIIDHINLEPIKNFVDKYIVPLGDYIDAIDRKVRGVQEATEGAAMSAEELLEMANKVIRGDYGNGKIRRDQLEELGYSYERIQNKVNELLGCSFRYEVAEDEMSESTSEASKVLDGQAAVLDELDKKFAIMENLRKFIGGLGDLVKLGKYAGQTIYNELITRAIGLLPGLLGFIVKRLGIFGSIISKVSNWIINFDYLGKSIRGFIDWIDIGVNVFKAFITPVKNFFNDVISSEAATNVFKDVVKIMERFLDAILGSGAAVKKAYGSFKALSGIQRLSEKLGSALKWLREKVLNTIIGAFEKLHEILGKDPKDKGVMKLFSEDGWLNKWANDTADAIDFVQRVIGSFSTAVGNKVENIRILFDKFVGFIANKFPKVGSIFRSVGDKFRDFFGFGKQAQENAFGGVLGLLTDLFDKIKNLEGVQKLTKALSDLGTVIKEKLIDGLKMLLEFIDKTFGTKLAGEGDEFINMFGEGGVVDTASDIIGELVDGLSNVPGAIEKFFSGIQNVPEWISSKGEFGAGLVAFFDTLRTEMSKGLPSFFSFVTKGMLGSLGDATASLAKEGLLGVFGEKFAGGIDIASGALGKFINYLLRIDSVTADLKKGFQLATAYGEEGQTFEEALENAIEFWHKIEPYAVPVVEEITEHLKNLKDWGLTDFFESLKALGFIKILFATGGAIKSFGSIFKETATIIKSFSGVAKSITDTFGAIGKAAGSFGTLAKNWSDVKGVFKQWRKKPFTTALRDFGVAVALVAGSIALLGSDLINYDKIRDNADILITFAGFFAVFTMALAMMPPQTLDAISKSFMGMGIGLLAVTAAIAIFGHMDPSVLLQGGLAVAALMLALAGAAKLASGSASMAGFGFLAMALAVDLLIPAILFFAHMAQNDWENLKKGGIALGVFMLLMAAAARLASSSGKMASFGFLAMALAVNLLIPAILIFSRMKPETLIKGGGAVVTFMMLMAVAIRIAGKSSGGAALAFLAIAVAINLIVPALILLSALKFTKILGAAIALGGCLMAIGASIEMASRNKGSIPAAIALAGAAWLVAIALIELSSFPLARVLAASVSLSLIFAALAIAFNSLKGLNMKQLYGEVGAMVLVVGGVGAVIWALATFTNVQTVVGIALSLSALILALTFALKLLAGIDPGTAIKAAAAIDAFAIIVGALVAAGAALVDYISNKFEVDVAEKLNQFGLAIHGFIAGLKGEDITQGAKEVEETGSSLSTFADNISRFLDILDGVDETKAANAEHLANAIWALTKAEIVQAISGWLGMDADFGTFGESLVGYANAFYNFVDVVEGEDEVGSDKLDAMATATERWIAIAKLIEPNRGLFPNIAGITDIGLFGEQMGNFAAGFYKFNKTILLAGTVNLKKIQDVKDGTTPMIELARSINANRGMIPTIIGITDIGLFGEQLGTFAVGFKKFHDEVVKVGTIQTDTISELATAVGPMVEVANSLTESGGFWQLIAGEKDLGKFGEALGKFAESLVSFCEITNVDTINPTRLMGIGNALTKIATLDGNANDAYAYLSAFSEAFGRLGASIGTFGENSKLFNPEDLENAIGAFEKLRDFISSLGEFSGEGVDGFIKAFKDVAKTSTKKFAEGFGESVDDVSAAITKFFIDVANKIANDNAAHFKIAGQGAASSYSTGFSFNGKVISGAVDRTVGLGLTAAAKKSDSFKVPGQNAATKFADGIDADAYKSRDKAEAMGKNAAGSLGGVYDEFYKKGKWAAQGFADGIEYEGRQAVNRAWDMADEAARALASALNEKSPSKRTRQMGVYFVEGFANGIEASYKMSERAVDFVASGALAAMMVAVGSLAAMIDQELPNEPVIRPVIDTSGVEYGMLRVNGMFGSMPGPVSSMVYSAANAQNQQLELRATRNSDYTDQFNQLIESNGELIDAVRQNRYAIIDGDEAFNYIDRRLGQAQG